MPILSCTKYILIHSLLFKDFRSIASPKLEKAQVSGQPTLLAHFIPLTKPDENLNCRVHIHWSACQSIRSRRHAACKGKSLAIRMSACVLTWNQCVFVCVCVCVWIMREEMKANQISSNTSCPNVTSRNKQTIVRDLKCLFQNVLFC